MPFSSSNLVGPFARSLGLPKVSADSPASWQVEVAMQPVTLSLCAPEGLDLRKLTAVDCGPRGPAPRAGLTERVVE